MSEKKEQDKCEIIHPVENSDISISKTLKELDIARVKLPKVVPLISRHSQG